MKLYNTLTGKKEEFRPRDRGKVSIYVCGPTVYNYIHIGNARAYIAFDAIIRYLKYKGYDVNYVRNLTDVDDKIIKRAALENTTTEEITKKYTQAFHKDMDILNVLEPNVEPKATEHIEDMIGTIKQLIDKGLAYEVDGDVYYSVNNFADYGKLSKRSLDEMIAGSRVDVDVRKKNPADFALWKRAKEGEPSWPSPWGSGRPGWHIECSTMSLKYLGISFDIHGGGQDLIFPHHENEIAQAEGATGNKPFVRYWLHNGFLNVEAEKMAKSVGNVVLIKDLEDEYEGRLNDLRNDLRMLFLSTHYHSPINYSDEKMKESHQSIERIQDTLYRINESLGAKEAKDVSIEILETNIESAKTNFEEAIEDDFNTPLALSAIFTLVKEINIFLDANTELSNKAKQALQKAKNLINELSSEILGLTFEEQPKSMIICSDELISVYENITGKKASTESGKKLIDELVQIRTQSRQAKNFARADEVRDKLYQIGLIIEDTPHGPKIKKK